MRDAGCLHTYVPVDISEEITHETAGLLVEEYPGLAVRGLVCDFEQHLERIPDGDGGRLIAFLGGTIGNLYPRAAPRLPRPPRGPARARATACCSAPTWSRSRPASRPPTTTPAASPPSSTRTCSTVLNRELGADFDLDAFEHVARYDAEARRGWTSACARSPTQTVRLDDLDLAVDFAAGEEMRTEISTKFTYERLAARLRGGRAGDERLVHRRGLRLRAQPRRARASRRRRSLRSQRLDQLAELVRRRDRGEDRQRDAALDEGADPLLHLAPASRR